VKAGRGAIERAVRDDRSEVTKMAKFHAETLPITKSMSDAKNTALGAKSGHMIICSKEMRTMKNPLKTLVSL
jgi:hypothetical protein